MDLIPRAARNEDNSCQHTFLIYSSCSHSAIMTPRKKKDEQHPRKEGTCFSNSGGGAVGKEALSSWGGGVGVEEQREVGDRGED